MKLISGPVPFVAWRCISLILVLLGVAAFLLVLHQEMYFLPAAVAQGLIGALTLAGWLAAIRFLLADREFVGREWMDFLFENNVPFAIRLKGDMRVTTDEGHELRIDAHLRGRGRGRMLKGWLGAGKGRGRHRLSFAAKPLDGEWLVVATNVDHRKALDAYRKRWAIENMFGDAKTRGLKIEDTRLTDPATLALLMGLVALAIAWAARIAKNRLGTRWPKRGAWGASDSGFVHSGYRGRRRRWYRARRLGAACL